MKKEFKDYYKLLQVHYDASPEVISAAYEKLSELPENAAATMQTDLKEAYQTLSDPTRRVIYHQEWLASFTERAQYFPDAQKTYHTEPNDKNASAESVLDDFFHALYLKDWKSAYLRLTDADRAHTSYEEFRDWRIAIHACYEMQEYELNYEKMLDLVTLDEIIYPQVVEFKVRITDLNQKTMEIATDTLRKYVTFENGSWKVCLGVYDVPHSTNRYRSLALQKQSQRSEKDQYKASRLDALTGLLSENVFYEEANREVARNHRYHNPFSLLSFQIHCPEKEQYDVCLKHLAGIIKSACRSTDLAARLDNNQIICLLIETEKENAEAAARKFLNLVKEHAGGHYSVSFGLVFYNGYSSLSDAVLACCHMAGLPSHY